MYGELFFFVCAFARQGASESLAAKLQRHISPLTGAAPAKAAARSGGILLPKQGLADVSGCGRMPDAVPPAEHAAWLVKSRGMVAKIKEEYFQENCFAKGRLLRDDETKRARRWTAATIR